MKQTAVVLLVLGGIGLTDATVQAQFRRMRRPEPAARYGWLSSLEEGTAQARKSGKPLMVVLRCVP